LGVVGYGDIGRWAADIAKKKPTTMQGMCSVAR
jgi:phosphoglycerate dehydrogenase-like enzyme